MCCRRARVSWARVCCPSPSCSTLTCAPPASIAGLLASDESTGTIGKRLEKAGHENSEVRVSGAAAVSQPHAAPGSAHMRAERDVAWALPCLLQDTRRRYRQLFYTAPIGEAGISGAILFKETLFQAADDGTPFTQCLTRQGVLPGIKVRGSRGRRCRKWGDGGRTLDDERPHGARAAAAGLWLGQHSSSPGARISTLHLHLHRWTRGWCRWTAALGRPAREAWTAWQPHARSMRRPARALPSGARGGRAAGASAPWAACCSRFGSYAACATVLPRRRAAPTNLPGRAPPAPLRRRAALKVGDGCPTERCIEENAAQLAEYAAICQVGGGQGLLGAATEQPQEGWRVACGRCLAGLLPRHPRRHPSLACVPSNR